MGSLPEATNKRGKQIKSSNGFGVVFLTMFLRPIFCAIHSLFTSYSFPIHSYSFLYLYPIHCLFMFIHFFSFPMHSYLFPIHCLFISFSFISFHFLRPEKFIKIPKRKDHFVSSISYLKTYENFKHFQSPIFSDS